MFTKDVAWPCLVLDHKDGEQRYVIRLDAEMAPLVDRYRWRWDPLRQVAYTCVPNELWGPLGLSSWRMDLQRLVAHAKRPYKEQQVTTVEFFNRKMIEDCRFRFLRPTYRNAPASVEALRNTEARYNATKLIRTKVAELRHILSESYADDIEARSATEAQLIERLIEIQREAAQPASENHVFDDVAEYEAAFEANREELTTEEDPENDDTWEPDETDKRSTAPIVTRVEDSAGNDWTEEEKARAFAGAEKHLAEKRARENPKS